MSMFVAGLSGFLGGVTLMTYAAARVYEGADRPFVAVGFTFAFLIVGGFQAYYIRQGERRDERREIEREYERLLEARRADDAVARSVGGSTT
jgi:hypothetical protein